MRTIGGGNRGRGRRKSFAINRPGAPQLVNVSGSGQLSLLTKPDSHHIIYKLPYPKQKDTHRVIFIGRQQQQLQRTLEKDTAKIAAESIIQILSLSIP